MTPTAPSFRIAITAAVGTAAAVLTAGADV